MKPPPHRENRSISPAGWQWSGAIRNPARLGRIYFGSHCPKPAESRSTWRWIQCKSEQAGGLLAINRQYVSVRGVWTTVQGSNARLTLQVEQLQILQPPNGPIPGAVPNLLSGPQPWISILCKFSDVPAEPKSLGYFQGMYGSSYPGLDHYWQEVSYNAITTAGSNAFGWITLPRPKSYYVYDQNGDGSPDLDLNRSFQDCTAAADAQVANYSTTRETRA